MKLSEIKGKSNNLQFLRFVAAILVIVSHAFSLSVGNSNQEWLICLTDGQLSFGELAVSMFFCAGGFLIAKSMERLQNGLIYFKARIIRIFPALVVVVLFSAFILGPMITEYSLNEYFKHSQVYKYLLNCFLILQHDLPGVFQQNPYLPTVNGVLWTLPVEFLCYIGCFLMWKLKLMERKKCPLSIPLMVAGILVVSIVSKKTGMEIILSAIRPILLFYIGVLYYVYREQIILKKEVFQIHLLLWIISIPLHFLNLTMIVCFPYILMYVCFSLKQISEKIGDFGNLSYGIYLCAYPIQQLIVWKYGGIMSPYWNMVLAIPLSIIIGFVLYRCVEEPFIKLKI